VGAFFAWGYNSGSFGISIPRASLIACTSFNVRGTSSRSLLPRYVREMPVISASAEVVMWSRAMTIRKCADTARARELGDGCFPDGTGIAYNPFKQG